MIQSLTASPLAQPRLISSGAEGKFAFEDLDPGRYSLSAGRTGFVHQSYGARGPNSSGTNLTLASSQEIEDIVFKLVPQGTISGKVVDEDGDPVEGASVGVYRYQYVRGHRQMQPFDWQTVHPDGTFLFAHLAPGRYYLSSDDGRNSGGPEFERYAGKGTEVGYTMTFVPGESDAASAAPIDVVSGGDVRGIEIRLRKSPLFHISGKLVGAPSSAPWLYLLEKFDGRSGALRTSSSGPVRRDGTFVFNHVAPGTYTIQTLSYEASNPRMAYAVVTVGDHDIENLVIAMTAGPEVSGTVKVVGWHSLQASPSASHQQIPTPRPNPFGFRSIQ